MTVLGKIIAVPNSISLPSQRDGESQREIAEDGVSQGCFVEQFLVLSGKPKGPVTKSQ
jgi:hypothetical protein